MFPPEKICIVVTQLKSAFLGGLSLVRDLKRWPFAPLVTIWELENIELAASGLIGFDDTFSIISPSLDSTYSLDSSLSPTLSLPTKIYNRIISDYRRREKGAGI